MKSKKIINLSEEEIVLKIKDNVDFKIHDIFFGTNLYMARFKNESEFLLITRTFRIYKKNFHCKLRQVGGNVEMIGEFKFGRFFLLLSLFCVVFLLSTLFILLFTNFSVMPFQDRIMLVFILLIFLGAKGLIFINRDRFGRKDRYLIEEFIGKTF